MNNQNIVYKVFRVYDHVLSSISVDYSHNPAGKNVCPKGQPFYVFLEATQAMAFLDYLAIFDSEGKDLVLCKCLGENVRKIHWCEHYKTKETIDFFWKFMKKHNAFALREKSMLSQFLKESKTLKEAYPAICPQYSYIVDSYIILKPIRILKEGSSDPRFGYTEHAWKLIMKKFERGE